MQVIAHHRKSQHINAKDPGQFFQSLADPFLAVRVILAGSPVLSAQVRSPNAPVNQMKRLDFIRRTQFCSIHPGHCSAFPPNWS
jgi:hypothetical protein